MNIRKVALLAIDSVFLVAAYFITYVISTLSGSAYDIDINKYILNFVFYYVLILAMDCKN